MTAPADAIQIAPGRRAPFTQLADWVLMSAVTPQAKALYWALMAHAHNVDKTAYPSRGRLAEILQLKQPRSIDPYVRELVSLGAVDVVPQKKANGGDSSNLYTVHETPPVGYDGPLSVWRSAPESTPPSALQRTPPVRQNAQGGVRHTAHELEVLELEVLELEKTNPRASRLPVAALPDRFGEFYDVYPRKTDRDKAEKAWQKIAPTERQEIIDAAARFRRNVEISQTEKRFIPHPSTWLNGKRWQDELVTASTPPGGRGSHRAYQDPTDLSAYLEDL